MERELWKILYRLAEILGKRQGEWLYTTSDILAVYFWAVLHDRPTSWAADPANWSDDLQPELFPPQSTLSRRLRRPTTIELMTVIEEHLLALVMAVRRSRRSGIPIGGQEDEGSRAWWSRPSSPK